MIETRHQIDRLIDVRRYDEARRLLQTIFAEAPGDADAHVQAARIDYMEDDNAAAEEHVRAALAADPTHYFARLLSHLIHAEEGRYAAAEQMILPLIRENPRDPDLLANYARLMMITANLDKARALTSEAMRIDPQNQEARLVNVMVSTIVGEADLANEELADLVRADPECRQVAYTLFIALTDQGRHREAFLLGQQLLRAEPDNAQLVEALVDLRAATHWLATPMYPFQHWGWLGSAGLWLGFVVIFGILRTTQSPIAGIFAVVYLAIVIYSWVYPPLMRRWLHSRGMS